MKRFRRIFGLLSGGAVALMSGCITDPGSMIFPDAGSKAASTAAYWNGHGQGGGGGGDGVSGSDDAGIANGNDNGVDNGNVNGDDNGNVNGDDNSNVNGGGATGACCYSDGTCAITTQAACELQARSNSGDCGCDGFVTVGDIGPFVLAVTSPVEYNLLFPDCPLQNADTNGDQVVSVTDIGPFVQIVAGGGSGAIGTWQGAGTDCTACGNGNGNSNTNTNGSGNENVNGDDNGNTNGAGNENVNAGGNENTNSAGNENVNAGGNENVNGTGNENVNAGGNENTNGAGNENVNAGGNENVNGTGNENVNAGGNENVNAGGNTNTNGAGNGNSNGTGGTCLDGSTRLRVDFAFDSRADYADAAGCRRFRVRTQGYPQSNVTVDVTVNGVVVGQMAIDSRGRGEIDTSGLPASFPQLQVGDVVGIGGVTSGILQSNCSVSGCS